MSNKFKKALKYTGLGVVGLAVTAATLGHFDIINMQPVYNFIKWNPAEFNWAAYGSAIAYFVGKATLDAVDSRRKYTSALNTSNLQKKLASEKELGDKLDKQFEAELKTQELMRTLIGMEIDKNEALANMSIAPASLRELADNTKNKLKDDSLAIGQEVTDTLIDKGLDIVTNVIDRQIEKL